MLSFDDLLLPCSTQANTSSTLVQALSCFSPPAPASCCPQQSPSTTQPDGNFRTPDLQCAFFSSEGSFSHPHSRMLARNLAVGMIFLSQTVTGILANLSLLYHYLSLRFAGYRLKPTDVIVRHLIIANSLVMIFKGVPQTLATLEVKYFFHDVGCTLLLYVHRVARGVSISTTCLLSVFQTIKISPMNSSWKQLKAKLSRHTGVCIFLNWILHMLVNCIFPLYSINKYNTKNITKIKDFRYCPAGFRDKTTEVLYAALVLFPEVSCSVLMVWSSGSMVLILHRHKQQVQHIRRTRDSPRSSPESRATQSVLVLICTFVSFYTLSSFFHAYIAIFSIPSWWLVNTSALISTCFPSVSPFVLMICNATASRIWVKFSNFIRHM